MKLPRAMTMYNVLVSSKIKEEITETGQYELTFHDAYGKCVAMVHLQKQNKGFKIHAVSSTDDGCVVVRDHVIDSVKRKFLSYMLGIDFGKCYDNYAIMTNNEVIAKISVDELTHAMSIKANSHTVYRVRKLPSTYLIEMTEQQCAILDSIGIDHNKQTLSDSGIHSLSRAQTFDDRGFETL